MDNKSDQAGRCRIGREENSMSRFRPKRLLLCFIASVAVTGAFAVQAHAWLLAPSPITDVVHVGAKQQAYFWSATRIGSGPRDRLRRPAWVAPRA